MANILDELKGMVTSQIISKAASSLGESESGVTKTIGALLPTILGGLVQKSADTNAFSNIFNMLSDQRNIGFLDNLSGLVGGGNLAQGDPKDIAGNLMGNLFGNKVGGILDLVSTFAGVKKSSTSSLLGLAGPLIMGFLGRKIKNEGLNIAGLASLLNGQKSSIMSALPAGMGNLLGLADIGGSVSAPKVGGNKWLPWLIGLLALAAILYFWRSCNKPADVVDQVQETAKEATETVTDAAKDAADATKEAVAGLGEFFAKKLACGVELNIPSNGIEANLVTFIEDASKPVDKTTWFNFDRLTFETGKATLDMTKSEEQLKNIAEIMKCYPKVKLKVGGYTDNVGDPAANKKLSQDRADNLKAALVALGVAANRMEAEGYGDQHPVASNDTEEGRAQNRRISCRVMEK
jgi:outer membrane protein OmpA-like peptidoglycan-associated protein